MKFFKIIYFFLLVSLLVLGFFCLAVLIYLLLAVICFDFSSFLLDTFSENFQEPLKNSVFPEKEEKEEQHFFLSFLSYIKSFCLLASAWYMEWLFLAYKKNTKLDIIVHQDSYLAYLDYLYENFGYTREMVENAKKLYDFYQDFFIIVKDFFVNFWTDFRFFNFFFGEDPFLIWLLNWLFGRP